MTASRVQATESAHKAAPALGYIARCIAVLLPLVATLERFRRPRR